MSNWSNLMLPSSKLQSLISLSYLVQSSFTKSQTKRSFYSWVINQISGNVDAALTISILTGVSVITLVKETPLCSSPVGSKECAKVRNKEKWVIRVFTNKKDRFFQFLSIKSHTCKHYGNIDLSCTLPVNLWQNIKNQPKREIANLPITLLVICNPMSSATYSHAGVHVRYF